MLHKSESELRAWAAEAIVILQVAGIDAAIDSTHDYLIKLAIARDGQAYGKLKVYHKPTKGTFTLDSGELRTPTKILPAIQAALGNPKVANSAPLPAKMADPGRVATSKMTSATPPPTSAPATDLAGWHLYVDGSYLHGRIGYGAVILHDGKLQETLHGVVTDPEAKSVHQIAGELMATTEALRWCSARNLSAVHIHHDYTGIARWATGEWKTNTLVTQEYAHFMRTQPIRVTWHKVAAHTGDYWNEMADRLAGGESITR